MTEREMFGSQWRSSGDDDVVLIVDGRGVVVRVVPASQEVLSRFLGSVSGLDLDGCEGLGEQPPVDRSAPESWGRLVISRGDYGQVLTIDPELYWDGILFWFRSRGVDYDTLPLEPFDPAPARAR